MGIKFDGLTNSLIWPVGLLKAWDVVLKPSCALSFFTALFLACSVCFFGLVDAACSIIFSKKPKNHTGGLNVLIK